MENSVTQKHRFLLLLGEVLILCAGSYVAFGHLYPPNNDKGFWFYTALLGLILGSRLDTPFFAKPSDVVLYAAPAAVALALANAWQTWDSGEHVAFVLAMAYCIISAALGGATILGRDARRPSLQRIFNSTRILAETLGAPRSIYSVLIGFALYAFHRHSTRELGAIVAAWFLTTAFSPLEGTFKLFRRIQKLWTPNAMLEADGEVAGYQLPGILLVRKLPGSQLKPTEIAAVNDPTGRPKVALALDEVGRDEGVLLRMLEIPDVKAPAEASAQVCSLPENAVAVIKGEFEGLRDARPIKECKRLIGLVAPDSSIEKIYFDVVQNDGLEEGRLVEVQIGTRFVTYQLLNGLTREEVVLKKNTFGFARASARKIGVWDSASKRFLTAKWMPQPNAPVYLLDVQSFAPDAEAVGHFPGTNYGVGLRKKDGYSVGLEAMVTHNTAILGILGVGKTSLALELVERLIVHGVKVVCIDLTNQYSVELKNYHDAAVDAAAVVKLQAIGAAGKSACKQNVQEGGSRAAFAKEVSNDLKAFLDTKNQAMVKIYNPAQFEVWRQSGGLFQGSAAMASLTPAEITHIISDATLEIVSQLGMTDKARVCLVYEEAHSLIPEWNSAVADGDKAAANGTARAILQGRKYGLGCLLITQRTANVTKTILNQCNTVFALRTFDETGKDFLANYLGKEYAAALPSLEERHAVFFGRASSSENPVLLRLNDRNDFLAVFRKPAATAV